MENGRNVYKNLKETSIKDERPFNRQNKFYRSLRTVSTAINGMEAIRGIDRKGEKRAFSSLFQ